MKSKHIGLIVLLITILVILFFVFRPTCSYEITPNSEEGGCYYSIRSCINLFTCSQPVVIMQCGEHNEVCGKQVECVCG